MQESVAWAQTFPPTAARGHEMLEELRSRLPPSEQRLRARAFELAHRFVDQSAAAGGAWAWTGKVYPPHVKRDGPHVDVEVIAGVAFVPDD